MSASTSTSASGPYLLVPNLHVPDATWPEVDLAAQPWVMATVIEDDDLTFGGKPLSTWYEEERTRQSTGSTASSHSSRSAGSSEGEYTDEEELRGRQRVRSHHRGGKEKKSGRKH